MAGLGTSYSFGEYRLDLKRGALLKAGVDVRLRPKSFGVLRVLIERRGELLTKDELLHAVWGQVIVTDGALTQCLIDVRRAIGDESQRMIKTVPRRGYIFDVPVAVSDGVPAEERPALARSASDIDERGAAPAAQPRLRSLRRNLVAVMLASLVPVAIWWGVDSRGTVAVPPVERGVAAQVPSNSIAVLPFVNMSDDPDSEYFCDGISEEILNRLAGFPELHVIARTSSFALKDSGLDVRKLSGLLGVRYLLQGSVRRDGGHVRIAAQLVDDSGVQVWSKAYERELRGVFAIQREIAEAVATNVVPKIMARSSVEPEPQPNLEAYQHYLAGRAIFDRRQPRYEQHAEEQFRRAVAIDPDYAEALAELAILWAFDPGTAQQAEQAIERALSLEPDLARAYAAQGVLLARRQQPDYARSEASFRQALKLDPNMVDASTWLSTVLTTQGRYAEGYALLESAARIDPLAPPLMTNLAMAYAERGDTARAERSLLRLLEMPQPSYYVYWTLVDFYSCTGRLVESNEMAKQLVLNYVETGPAGAYGYLAGSYSRLGLWRLAEYWLERLERERQDGPDPSNLNRLELLRLEGRFEEATRAIKAHGTTGSKGPAPVSLEYGVLEAMTGDYRAAIQTLAPQLNVDGPSRDVLDANPRHALAWAYLQTGATDRAHTILSELERGFRQRQAEGWLHLSGDLAMFAQNAVLAGDKGLAIDRMRQAVDAGWREYYSVSNDPRWGSLRDDVRFKELMGRVKADIDSQRARLEQIEAKDDTVARLDAASKNRRTQQ
jgi:TolB-like protein/DNA-binding winged helix-turn-helix (wHTH) protein/Flp pilus assembly protein TadD